MKREIRKLRQSFVCAFRGIYSCMRTERNFRIHLVAAAYVSLAALIAELGTVKYAVLCVCFGMMLSAELMNTAVEYLCDRQATGYDNFVRAAKDIAAGAVFLCALFCVLVGAAFFLADGALFPVLDFFAARLWAVGLLLVSLPAAAWFVFGFGRVR